MPYAISTSHPLTLEAMEEVLLAGGNAVDAAIAGFLMSWVAEPCMSSAGGGGFAQVFFDGNQPLVFDFFCQTPKRKLSAAQMDFFPVTVDFGSATEVFHVGRGSTAVPGSVAGVFALYKKFGTMPFNELAQPAIAAAKEGVVVNTFNYYIHKLLRSILELHSVGRAIFFENDEMTALGAKRFMPELGDYLDYLAREGPNAFYKGEVARKIVQDHQQNGGCLQQADFEEYQVNIKKPLLINYHQYQIFANPRPSLGGYYLQSYFNYFKNAVPANHPFTAQYLEHLFNAYQSLEEDKRKEGGALGRFLAQLKSGGTTHFNVVDQWGNAVSLSSSNGEGSGSFAEGTNIQLNNMLGEAALLPGGFHSWKPDTRLSSLMTPTLVFEENKLKLVLGSSGAGRIASALFQIIYLSLVYGLDLEAAVSAPRAHFQDEVFNVEPGFQEGYQHPNEYYKIWDKLSVYFGGVNAIERNNNLWTAVGDQRRSGVGKAVN